MAPTQEAPSFDDIIQAGRERKKAEDLASAILGKGRRTSSPFTGGRAKPGGAHSLANRITKPGQRVTSSSPIVNTRLQTPRNQDGGANGRGFQRSSHPPRGASDFEGQSNGNSLGTKEFSIKGAAGPYVVMGSNFAPGTTSADIQSAMEAITGEMISCNIISTYPTVIAEMVFAEKACADTVVQTFNNQKADGRLLKVYLKKGPPTHQPTQEPVAEPTTLPPSRPYAANPGSHNKEPRELIPERHNDYNTGSANERRAEPEFQDGRFGFASKEDEMEMDVNDQPRAMRPENSRDSRNENRNGRSEDLYVDDRNTKYGFRPGYSRYNRPSGVPGSSDRRDYNGHDGRYRNENRRPLDSGRFYSDSYNHGSRGRSYH